MYKIVYDKQAVKDIQNLKSAKLDTKAKSIIELLKRNPRQPPYEALVANLSGLFSRRLNIQHRIVYEIIEGEFIEGENIYEGIVKVIRMWTPYEKVT